MGAVVAVAHCSLTRSVILVAVSLGTLTPRSSAGNLPVKARFSDKYQIRAPSP